MNLFDLTGKVAVVTGGRNGNLGPIFVDVLIKHGATVYTFDLPYEDVTNIEHIRQWRDDAEIHPDILVNNAAIDNPPGSGSSFFGNFKEIINVNLCGAVNMCEVFMPDLKRHRGVVVNIGSIQGNVGADWRNYDEEFEKPVGYNCSKAALVQLSRSITVQYGRYGVRSVTISFGPYDGGKLSPEFLSKFLYNVPLNRTISRESIQQTLLHACCCKELTGQQVLVDAGYTAL